VRERAAFAAPIGGLTALAVAGLLVPVRGAIDSADVALALALIVVATAGLGGRRAGVVTAGVAALSFDLLHAPPYGSLHIADLDDVLTTVLLAVLGVLAGEVAERLHQTRQRRSEIDELQRLRRVADRASHGDTSEDLTLQVCAELLAGLELRDCWYEVAPFLGDLPVLDPDASASDRFQLPRSGASILLRSGGRLVGRFVLAPDQRVRLPIERRVVAVTLVEQLAAVIALRSA
jgi:hypothetical protein